MTIRAQQTPQVAPWTVESTGVPGFVPFGTHNQEGEGSLASRANEEFIAAGVRLLRSSARWDSSTDNGTYPPGVYTIGAQTDLEAYVNKCVELGIEPLLVLKGSSLNFGHPSYGDGSLQNGGATEIAAHASWCAAVVTYYANRVKWFAIGNEFDINGLYPTAIYRQTVDAASAAMRAAAAAAGSPLKILAPVSSGPWNSFANAALYNSTLKDVIDVLDVHQYAAGAQGRPELLFSLTRSNFGVIWRSMGVPTYPIIISEQGWSSALGGGFYSVGSEVEIGKRISRMVPYWRCLPGLIGYVYFQGYGGAPGSTDEQGCFGLLNTSHTAKSYCAVFKDCVDHCHWGRSASLMKESGAPALTSGLASARAVILRNAGAERMFVMSPAGSVAVDIIANAPAGTTPTLNIMTPGVGVTTQVLAAGNNRITVTATDTSQILYGTGITFPQMRDG